MALIVFNDAQIPSPDRRALRAVVYVYDSLACWSDSPGLPIDDAILGPVGKPVRLSNESARAHLSRRKGTAAG
ncbi:hypothetical protein HJFPF1_06962 [Paramyrothecium foliicola]|nr:hypothetical protein HJFPF1_06962 [Paramyrothecium foliicola]